MELNVSAGCSTLLAGSRASPLEVRKNARMAQSRAMRAMRVTELRLNGNEDERHYDAVLNNNMYTHAHTHAAVHVYSYIYTYI